MTQWLLFQRVHPKENKQNTQRLAQENLSSFIQNSQKLPKAQVSINTETDKLSYILYNEILLSTIWNKQMLLKNMLNERSLVHKAYTTWLHLHEVLRQENLISDETYQKRRWDVCGNWVGRSRRKFLGWWFYTLSGIWLTQVICMSKLTTCNT
jgi:hypothetical protein